MPFEGLSDSGGKRRRGKKGRKWEEGERMRKCYGEKYGWREE